MLALWGALATGAAFALSGGAARAADGAGLASACTSCHGVNGRSQSAIPTIADRDAGAIETALKGYKSGERAGTIMNRIARGYSDEQIALIAAYFSKVQP